MSNPMRLVLSLAALVVLLFFGASRDQRYTRAMPDVKAAEGRIVAWSQNRATNRRFIPIVEFQDANGVSHRFANAAARPVLGFQIGSSVRVVYSTANPDTARIDHWWMNHKNTLIFGTIGLMAVVASVTAGSMTRMHRS
jgi:hypothetical protein